MNAKFNETLKVPTGLELCQPVVTSLQIQRYSDGTAAIVMTDGAKSLRIFATADQVVHVIGLLSPASVRSDVSLGATSPKDASTATGPTNDD
ncbi:hypothetical protein EJD96_16035 [Herbaspirillum seropedicae]|uniref:hypothetical protein n=1 Tax=Herbaspirillum seropedicae TaxID=964 RepID=UPI0011215A49|nr:hypothetical protein [Herbaspirillum seropedicae]QDD65558.1 hypothetical protein EJD96_16035 [Herbaspirillum seropedicae]